MAKSKRGRENEGRPTDYTEELLSKAQAYLDESIDNKEFYPSIAELSFELDIARKTIYEWIGQENKKQFSDIVEKILTLQEIRLSENGLQGKYNSSITKLMLTKHGYTDKQDVTSDGKAIPVSGVEISIRK